MSGSNRRPTPCKGVALPAELIPRCAKQRVGLGGLEPPTSRLSGVRSNQLSYRPASASGDRFSQNQVEYGNEWCLTGFGALAGSELLRKEVIQPQVPLRLPCYDFTPVAHQTLGACLLAVSAATSGPTNSHGVTGGVYKARERIHRGMLIRDY